MAGHSHSHNVAKRKGVQDVKRSKEFTAVARLIMSAVKKSGNPKPEENPALRLAMDKARTVNMPNENVARAIKRGAGKSEGGASLDETVYEGYGPHGIGFLVQVRTDNKQRTTAEIRSIFSSNGGSLAGPGAASYLFTLQDGEYTVAIPVELSEEQMNEVQILSDELEANDDVDGVWHNAKV
ncbi:MAG: YebC/PmpR family DNA-binding transcriptional regulator [Candidatus Woesebacteria bacterium]